MTRTRKTAAAVAVAAAAAVTATALVLTGTVGSRSVLHPNPSGSAVVQVADVVKGTAPAAVLAAAPTSRIMDLTTPPTEQWWTEVTRYAPDLRLPGMNPTVTGAKITGYGYVMATPKDDTLAASLPLFGSALVATASPQDATTVADWFTKQAGHTNRRSYISGSVAVLAPEWSDGTDFTLTGAPTGTPVTSARLQWNTGQWLAALTDAATDKGRSEVAAGVIRNLGVSTDTTFIVTASAPDGPWTGRSEHANPQAVNPSLIAAMLNDTAQQAAAGSGSDVTTEMTLIDPDLYQMMRGGQFATFADGKPTQPQTTFKTLAPPAARGVTALFTLPLQRMVAYTLGFTPQRTGPTALTVQFDTAGAVSAQAVFE